MNEKTSRRQDVQKLAEENRTNGKRDIREEKERKKERKKLGGGGGVCVVCVGETRLKKAMK